MTERRVEELILLHLLEGGSSRYERSTPGIAATLGLDGTMAERVSLFSALSSVTKRGLVDSSVESVEGLHGERTVYSLTAEGRERARERYDRVTSEPVVVHGERTRELELGAVPDEYDLSLVRALTARSPDGALYLESQPKTTFVGRENELGRLVSVLDDALAGDPQVAAISGTAGSGKTELVERFATEARTRGFDVMVGHCRRDGAGPYHPIEEAIERAFDEPVDDPFDTDGAAVVDEETYEAGVSNLFYGIATWLTGRANDQPLVVIVEDVQWADAATLDLLEYLLDALERAPLAIVWSCRSGPLRSDERLSSFLESTAAAGTHVTLAPLEREAVVELLEGYVGHRGVPDSFVDVVVEGTGGNPLFVVETVESLLEDGTIDPVRGEYPERMADIEVPDVVGTTIERRLDRLDSNTRSVVEAGAVIGTTIRFDLLAAITDHEEPLLREYADALVDGSVWRRDGPGEYRFASEVLRTTVYGTIEEDDRRTLHGAVATALAAVDDDSSEHHASVAYHYERGGEPERALEHAIEAGEAAKRVYAHDVAIEYYERALRLSRELDREATVLETLETLGDIFYTRGRYDEAEKHFRYIRERTDDPERVRRTYRYQAQLCFARGEYAETEHYATEGLEVATGDVSREVCRLQDFLAGSYYHRGDFEGALEGHRRLRELAESIDDDLMLGRAYQNIGCCYDRLEDSDLAIDYLERAVSLMESAGDDRELIGCLNDLAVTYSWSGGYDRARDVLLRAKDLAERTGDVVHRALILNNLAAFAEYDGDWDTARKNVEEAHALGERIDSDDTLMSALMIKSTIAVERGSVADAIEYCHSSVDIVRRADRVYQLGQFLVTLGRYYVLDGSFDEAGEYVAEGLELAREQEFELVVSYGTLVTGLLERERGNFDRAIDRQREALETIRQVGPDDQVAYYQGELAETLARGGDPAAALDESEAALTMFDDIDTHRVAELYAEVARGAALVRLGEHDAARDQLTDTLESARSTSNVATLRALRELARLESESVAAMRWIEAGRKLAAETEMDLFVETFDAFEDRI